MPEYNSLETKFIIHNLSSDHRVHLGISRNDNNYLFIVSFNATREDIIETTTNDSIKNKHDLNCCQT